VSKDRKVFSLEAGSVRLFPLPIVMGALILACTSLPVACVPFFPFVKSTDGGSNSAAGSGTLIRPKIQQEQSKEVKTPKREQNPPELPVEQEFTDMPSRSERNQQKGTTPEDNPNKGKNRTASLTKPQNGPSTPSEHATVSPTRRVSASPKRGDSDLQKQKNPRSVASEAGKKAHSVDMRFRKPDHKKYAGRIRNQAINVLNKAGSCALARLCRDDMTGEWNLTLYRKHNKSFNFVVYTWDPIDEAFEQSFESAPRPLKQWKHHQKFAVISKDCSILKGTVE
jgi:hypothetical protein